MIKLILLIFTLNLLNLSNLQAESLSPDNFPIPQEIRTRADFWKKVYTVVDSDQGFLHDQDDLTIVYEVVDLKGMSRRQQIRHVKNRKHKIKSLLLSIAKKKKENLSEDELQFYLTLLDKDPEQIKKLAKKIRWQRGMSDRFRQGLVDSYLYLTHIKEIFKEEGVPQELAYLPHVESSFNYKAYSKVGAAGIWQFMRSTARVYKLKMNYVVDERLDPLLGAHAAARLLKNNFMRLGAWPLAVTAYNHGPHGMERAARKLSTTHIGEIIQNYNGGRFGFASKNFYASFVAAYELAQDPQKYFGNITKPDTLKFSEITLEKPLTVKQIIETSNIDIETFKIFNRSIRPIAFKSRVPIPKDTRIKLPEVSIAEIEKIENKMDEEKEAQLDQNIAQTHIVTRGDSLYTISKIYKIPLNDIIVANRMVNPRSIYPGMKIKIPANKKSLLPKGRELAESEDELLPLPTLPDDISKNYNFEIKKVDDDFYTLVVEVNEGLAQYAEWLEKDEGELKKLNNLSEKKKLKMGQMMKFPLKEAQAYDFNLKRVQYHMAIEEDFYSNFKVEGLKKYKVRRGDNLIKLGVKKEIPLWLIRKYLPIDKKFRVKAGQMIHLPHIVDLSNQKAVN